jgi:uncharacterized protein YndB with AHSA1/START domain
MSVKKEASGRRSVQVEVEVPGTPEEVWRAIATGPGISSWFMPTEFEEQGGKPVAVTSKFGPGMEPRSVVTAWDPPRMFAAQGEGCGGSPPIATEWSVQARAGGVCVVRVVHSLFASTDDWDNQLEATESGWPGYFRTLRIYLTHFRSQRCAIIAVASVVSRTLPDAVGLTRRDVSESGVVYECAGRTAGFLYPAPNAGTSQASQAFWQVEDIERELGELNARGVVCEAYDRPEANFGHGSATGLQKGQGVGDSHRQPLESIGSPTWARTRDLRINSPALYRLSYRGTTLNYSQPGACFRPRHRRRRCLRTPPVP